MKENAEILLSSSLSKIPAAMSHCTAEEGYLGGFHWFVLQWTIVKPKFGLMRHTQDPKGPSNTHRKILLLLQY